MNLEEAESSIKSAWIAALITAVATLILTLVYIKGINFSIVDIWTWLDIFFLFALAFGVYMKNRAAAVILPIYYLIIKLFDWVQTGAFIGVPIALVFTYFFVQGIRGAFAYHRLQASGESMSLS